MYLPKHFEVSDFSDIAQFVSGAGAVDLVTVDDINQPISSLLPCIWDSSSLEKDKYGTLIMHMAKLNNQWRTIKEGSRGLAIAHGFGAYVSPSNYTDKETHHRVVPTWNYQSVHLSGVVEISHDPERLREIVSSLTDLHESGRQDPWNTDQADSKYMEGQLKAIVAVTMRIDRVEAKYKLSQNRSKEDQENVIADLQGSNSLSAREVGNEMRRSL